ncbi:hypothetical protein D3C78_945340 [compost metagenome]
MLLGEGWRADNRGGGTTGGWAGHQAGHDTGPHDLVVHHLFGADNGLEQRQGIVGRVATGFGANGGKGFHARTVLLHVFTAGATKGLQGAWQVNIAGQVFHHMDDTGAGNRTIVPVRLQRTSLHLLEAQRQHTLGLAALHGSTGQVQRGGASGAIVVDVDDRDTGATDFIQGGLAAGGVTVDIAGECHLHLGIVNAGILERQARCLRPHVGVTRARTGLGERDHADPGYHHFVAHRLMSFAMLTQLGNRRPAGGHGYPS